MFLILTSEQRERPDIDRLIADYSKILVRFCYLYLKDYHLAEDAAQDTLIRAYIKYDTFSNRCSEKTWITKIAINVCKNYIRKNSYKEVTTDKEITLYTDPENVNTQYTNEDAVLLLNTIFTLPEIYKQVILLHYYIGLSIVEMCNVLGKNQGTISVRLKRGRELLKKILQEA